MSAPPIAVPARGAAAIGTPGAEAVGNTPRAGTAPSHQTPSQRLEARLADAARYGGPFSSAYSARLDAREEFPLEAVRVLDDFGLPRHYVPVGRGGALDDMFELMQLLRVVSRRDLTVAIAYGKTFLGSAPIWVGGSDEQAQWLAAQVSDAHLVTWALTERDHGGDLLSGELTAKRTEHGWRLNGQKWLINNATRASLVCLLARTSDAGGARGFSLFLVDKRTLAPESHSCLPKELLHGIRGADISGISFTDAHLPAHALIGAEGTGLELVLKTMQLTRTACVSLSMGAADHALQLALGFASRRRLYGRRLTDIPLVRWSLGKLATGVLLCEAVSLVAARCIHALPEEMSVVAAIAKALLPAVADEVVAQAGELLGARSTLISEFDEGMFQKLERDHRIVSIFDGSTVVNRNSLINQFPILARSYPRGLWDSAALERAVSLSGHIPTLDYGKLSLMSRRGCSVLQSFPDAARTLRARYREEPAHAEVLALTDALEVAIAGVVAEMAAYRPDSREVPDTAFQLARRYELCFAGAACVRLWLHNVHQVEADNLLWRHGSWLRACMTYLVNALGVPTDDVAIYERMADILLAPAATTPTAEVSSELPPVSLFSALSYRDVRP